MALTIDDVHRELIEHGRKLSDHMLEDAERQGAMMGELGGIKADLRYLVNASKDQKEALEKSGSYDVEQLQKKADFWPQLITKAVITLCASGVVSLIGYWATHHTP